jgi:cell division protein FtsB
VQKVYRCKMAKTKVIISALIVLLVFSCSFNVYQWQSTQMLNQQNTEAETRQDMVSQLMHTQNNVNTQLAKLDTALSAACQQLSTLPLDGAQARAILSELISNNSLIVNAATCDAKDVLVALEPSSYSDIEGQDIKAQEQNVRMHQTMRAAMSDMIPLVEGFPGVVMVSPIFDASEKLVGSLSLVVQPSALVQQSIASTSSSVGFSMWAMQKNGTLIYDPDPAQQGKNLLTDSIYSAYPEVQAFTRNVAAQQSGYGSYQYYDTNLDNTAKQVVNKEAYWATVGIYSTEWRLVIWHKLNP